MADTVTAFADPFREFDAWIKGAEKTEINDPTAVAVATVGEDGFPSLRMVLLKSWGEDGFTFYTQLPKP